jgi:hypothetical protein
MEQLPDLEESAKYLLCELANCGAEIPGLVWVSEKELEVKEDPFHYTSLLTEELLGLGEFSVDELKFLMEIHHTAEHDFQVKFNDVNYRTVSRGDAFLVFTHNEKTIVDLVTLAVSLASNVIGSTINKTDVQIFTVRYYPEDGSLSFEVEYKS